MDRFKSLIERLRDPKRVNPNERDEWAAAQIEVLREVLKVVIEQEDCAFCGPIRCGDSSEPITISCEERATAWLLSIAEERINERLAGENGSGGIAAEDASAPVPAPAGSLPITDDKFRALYCRWMNERPWYSSSIQDYAACPAYQQIIGMGEKALPFIFEELKRENDHWYWALEAITGINPVPAEHRGDYALMRLDWLLWAKNNGYIMEDAPQPQITLSPGAKEAITSGKFQPLPRVTGMDIILDEQLKNEPTDEERWLNNCPCHGCTDRMKCIEEVWSCGKHDKWLGRQPRNTNEEPK